MYGIVKKNDSLWHHGVKGQKWGIKHGPPYPIDRNQPLTIKKGSTLASVSTTKNLKLDSRGIYAYDPSDRWDKTVYEGAYSTYIRWYANRGKKVFSHRFENKEDLILPSHEEKVKSFMDLYKNDKTFASEYSNALRQVNKDTLKRVDEWAKSLVGGDKNWNMKYQRFMMMFNEHPDMMVSSKKFVDKLASKGYNAIIDDNNSGFYNRANTPLYVFNGAQSLKQTGRRRVSEKEIRRNSDEIRRQTGKVML